MPAVSLYFRVHQPYQLSAYAAKDIGICHDYDDPVADERLIRLLAQQCYLPANKLLLQLIRDYKGRVKVAFSISGIVLELLRKYYPYVITTFQQLVATGCVELLAETYYNSLSWQYAPTVFRQQVRKHHRLMMDFFQVEPVVFRNTGLVYDNELAACLAEMGYKGVTSEADEKIWQGRTSNRVYGAAGSEVGVLLRNPGLSDDIAFRFDDTGWAAYPLTAEKFAAWIHAHDEEVDTINLMMDYETFGIHKKAQTGIFDFLKQLPAALLADPGWTFATPREILTKSKAAAIYDVPRIISRQDGAGFCNSGSEQVMRNNMLRKIYSLEQLVYNCRDEWVVTTWNRLQAADYFRILMGNKDVNQDLCKQANPPSTSTAALHFLNILTDFEIYLIRKNLASYKREKDHLSTALLY